MKIPNEVGVRLIEALDVINKTKLVFVVRKRRTSIGTPMWLAYVGKTTRTSEATHSSIHKDYYWAIIYLGEYIKTVEG